MSVLQESCFTEKGCDSGAGAVGLWTLFSPPVADYDTKRLYYFKTVHYLIWNGCSHHHPAVIATLYLRFGEFSTQTKCSSFPGQQSCKKLVCEWQNRGKCWWRWCCAAECPSQRWIPRSGPSWSVHLARVIGQGKRSTKLTESCWELTDPSAFSQFSTTGLGQTVAMEDKISMGYINQCVMFCNTWNHHSGSCHLPWAGQ